MTVEKVQPSYSSVTIKCSGCVQLYTEDGTRVDEFGTVPSNLQVEVRTIV